MNLSDVLTELKGLAQGSLEDIDNPQFLRLLNRAIDNRYDEVSSTCKNNYLKQVTIPASGEFTVDLPDNFYQREDRVSWQVYQDINFSILSGGKESLFKLQGGKLKFSYKMQNPIYLQYTKKPTRYTDASLSEEFLEENAMEMLLSETQALFYGSIDENEPNASYTNSLSQANRSS